jgi:hypothetical protein
VFIFVSTVTISYFCKFIISNKYISVYSSQIIWYVYRPYGWIWVALLMLVLMAEGALVAIA